MRNIGFDIKYVEQELLIQSLQRQLIITNKELQLYREHCVRPKVLKEVIHHSRKSRTSTCLYGVRAWDEYIYE